jgi:hypothetical protein
MRIYSVKATFMRLSPQNMPARYARAGMFSLSRLIDSRYTYDARLCGLARNELRCVSGQAASGDILRGSGRVVLDALNKCKYEGGTGNAAREFSF